MDVPVDLSERGIVISAAAMLTPLDEPRAVLGGEGTWEKLMAGEGVRERVSVHERLIDPEVQLDRSIRIALGVVRRLNVDFGGADLFCGTSKGPVTTMLGAMDALKKGGDWEFGGGGLSEIQALQVAMGPAAMGVMLRERLKLTGNVHTNVAACASGMHALHRAVRAMENGECEKALVVAADASLHELFEGSFLRLGVLAPVGECEPFGEEGKGFFLAEAGAAVLLERVGHGGKGLARIEKTWIGGDGTGLIAIDERTETLRAGLGVVGGGDLAFVHAHATGTGHDRYEMEAIRAVLGNSTPLPPPHVFSHKGRLGHTLGAAGLVSVVISAMSHGRGESPFFSGDVGGSSVTIAQGFGGHVGMVRMKAGG